MRVSFDCLPDRPKPNIAALNGAATGAGCVTAVCCDIIRTSDKGFLQMTEVNVGLAGAVAVFVARAGPSAVRAAKKSFQPTEGVSIHDGHRFGRSLTKAFATSKDAAEATGAFREKRPPSFKG